MFACSIWLCSYKLCWQCVSLESDCEFKWQHEATALMLAADSGHSDCVRMLVVADADMEAKDSVRAGLFLAVFVFVRWYFCIDIFMYGIPNVCVLHRSFVRLLYWMLAFSCQYWLFS